MSDFWVFGYGSLMWKPGFPHEEVSPARISGLHRSLCIYSWVHRGTQDNPGLVFGLDRGGACNGMAFRVKGAERIDVIEYLRARELVTNVYRETSRMITLEDGHKTRAVAYVVDPTSPQYAGRLPHHELLDHVRDAVGQSGKNDEYVVQTVEQLRRMNIRDHKLERLADELASGQCNTTQQ